MKIAVGPLQLDVPFDTAGPFMPAMGIAIGPADQMDAVPMAGIAALTKVAKKAYRRTLSSTCVVMDDGADEVEAVVGELRRLSAALRASITAEEQGTVAGRTAAIVELQHTDGAMPILTQAAVFCANGVLHTIALSALNGKNAADARKQFRGTLTKVSAFGDPKPKT